MTSRKRETRISVSDPSLLDRRLVSTAEGALPVYARVSVLFAHGWDDGLITQSYSCLNAEGKPRIMYRIAYDSGKEQETDLGSKDARLITAHSADTPRLHRKPSAQNNAGAPSTVVTNIPSPSRLAELKVPELRKMCMDIGLESKGTKKELTTILGRAHAAAKAMLSGLPLDQPATGEDDAAPDRRPTLAQHDRVSELEALIASLRSQLLAATAATEAADARAAEVPRLLQLISDREASLSESTAALAASVATAAQLRTALATSEAQAEGLRQQVSELEEREEDLQSELMELKGSVRVLCRLRPPKGSGSAPVAEATGLMSSGIARSLTLSAGAGAAPARTFAFDRVFDSCAPNEVVFSELRPLAMAVADGSRATVLAYGQTGSGKTYTMLHLQRMAVQSVLERVALASGGAPTSVALRLAVVEVYNEKLADLLAPESHESEERHKPLELRLGRDGNPYVEGVSWHPIRSADSAEALVGAASRRRATADNGLNERSSRSHMVMLYQLVSGPSELPAGLLTLVDLAGSERLSRTEATGSLAAETAAINKSLSALGDVMTAIGQKESHVPFRNSKLTFLLQPALSRGARVMFIITASPDRVDAPETLVSIGFGTRARLAQLGQERKQAGAATVTAAAGTVATSSAPTPTRMPKTPDGAQDGAGGPRRMPKTPDGAGALTPTLGNKTTPRAGGAGATGGPSKTPNRTPSSSSGVHGAQHGAKRPYTAGGERAVKQRAEEL